MKKIALAALLLAASIQAATCAGYDALNVGIQYTNDEAWDNAILWLGKAIDAGDLLPDQMRAARYNRAKAYVGAGKPGLAIADFTAALAATPDDVQIMIERAFAYIADGHGDQAIADFQAAHIKKTKSTQINFYMGVVNWSIGHPQDASMAFAQTLKDNKSPFAWIWLKLSDMKQNKETAGYTGSTFYWPGAIISLYSGGKDEAAVLDNAKEYGDDENCEAIFYIAEWRLTHNDAAGAKLMFRQATADCSRDSLERPLAQQELGNLP